jgi:hypothetical protein
MIDMHGHLNEQFDPRRRHRLTRSLALLVAILLVACSAPQTSTPTTLHVAPDGDDVSGTGSAGQPYRTLGRAADQAPAGATIMLASGTYSAASGEAFPIDISGLTVRGQGEADTIIAGTTAALYGLTIASGETTIRDLSVQGFGTSPVGANVLVEGGSVRIEDVIIADGARHGIQITSGAVTLRSVTVTANQDDNVSTNGTVTLDVFGSVISASADADGIDTDGNTTLRVRDTQIVDNDGSGIELNGGTADLGTIADPGGNTLTGNAIEGGSSAQLEDDRPPGAPLITAVGNDLGTPVSGVVTGPDSLGHVWIIKAVGNQIDFGP